MSIGFRRSLPHLQTIEKNLMTKMFEKKAVWLSVVFLLLFGLSATTENYGQPVYSKPTTPPTKPLLQPITVQPDNKPAPSETPLVKKTGSAMPSAGAAMGSAIKTSIPILRDTAIPGYSGILVEDLEGNIVVETYSDYAFIRRQTSKSPLHMPFLKTFRSRLPFPDAALDGRAIRAGNRNYSRNVYFRDATRFLITNTPFAISND